MIANTIQSFLFENEHVTIFSDIMKENWFIDLIKTNII